MKILQQLKENHYTESEQQVIDYLLDHLEDLTLLSINDLAKKKLYFKCHDYSFMS